MHPSPGLLDSINLTRRRVKAASTHESSGLECNLCEARFDKISRHLHHAMLTVFLECSPHVLPYVKEKYQSSAAIPLFAYSVTPSFAMLYIFHRLSDSVSLNTAAY